MSLNNMLHPGVATPSNHSVASMLPPSRFSSSIELVSRPTPCASSLAAMNELADLTAMAPKQDPYPLRYLPVENYLVCPNFKCNVNFPHVYSDLLGRAPPPVGITVVTIQRFDALSNPFPKHNRWEVTIMPDRSLKHNMTIYLTWYGLVTLHCATSTNPAWRIFKCINIDGFTQAEIAIPIKWSSTWFSCLPFC
jgi:hypothetical protein